MLLINFFKLLHFITYIAKIYTGIIISVPVVPEAAARKGGKSGLHRAGSCRKAGRGNPAERATENRLPVLIDRKVGGNTEWSIRAGKGETVG